MSDIHYRIKEFYRLIQIGKSISKQNRRQIHTSSIRSFFSETIYEKSLLNANSIINLIPNSNEDNYKESQKYLDISSVASLSRNLIEIHNVYNYMCERGISDDEFNFRFYLSSYHQNFSSERIILTLGIPKSSGYLAGYGLFYSESMLTNNNVFLSLSEGLKRELIKGKKPFLFDRIRKRYSPINKEVESGIYNLLSNSVHTLPIGLFNNSAYPGDSHLDRNNLAFIALETSILFFSTILLDYVKRRNKLSKMLTSEDLIFITEMTKSDNLMNWIKHRSAVE
ncbi:hypothetical protein [Paenibacillus sp. IHBB 10380]|uniref:hypothetical protein n=1 Tax=Paenibacillus sp. IHBB 10380 TaxID=1566358 RepID=UPI0005CFB2B3|nr:hypothetical protein [Paenibacillus sp. IHBB 10380]AJS58190.1 hypothetical protein UB51_06395 [Paenibacillus sp. IHBB 10380]